MKIIAGLGNPGKEYENTKHNVGFLTIDILAEKYDIKVNKIKFKGLVGEGMIGTEKVILVKPQTYMILSYSSTVYLCDYSGSVLAFSSSARSKGQR